MSRPNPSIDAALLSELPRHGRLLIAVSGGIDSVVLLEACAALRRQLDLSLHVAHVDHGLRPNSERDANFVAELSRQHGIPCSQTRLSPPLTGNLEAWGRQERYQYFAELRVKLGFEWTVTAHQADDLAENLLMRLVSNKEPGEISARDVRRCLLRPLLSIPRILIEEYASHHDLRWVEDETNADHSFLRNKVRHSLLPLLSEQFDSRIVETLASRAEALAQDASALDAWAASEYERLRPLTFGSREWLQAVIAVVRALEPAVQWRVVRDLLSSELGYPLGRSPSQRVVEFLLSGEEGVQIPGGTSLRRRDGGVVKASS